MNLNSILTPVKLSCLALSFCLLILSCGLTDNTGRTESRENSGQSLKNSNEVIQPGDENSENGSQAGLKTSGPQEEASNERIDYFTFASGAIPLSVGGSGTTDLGVGFEQAIYLVDGSNSTFALTRKPWKEGNFDFIYKLPALTIFDRFAVPDIGETPSPLQTFVKEVEIYGSRESQDSGYSLLAKVTLSTHGGHGEVTELEIVSKKASRWIKVSLTGGIKIEAEKTFLEFSEIIGNGTQEVIMIPNNFSGIWKDRGLLIQLFQDGSAVSGCYDAETKFMGTLSGNILKGSGTDPRDGSISLFVLSILGNGDLRGLRSSNGAPFKIYSGPPAAKGTKTSCSIPEKPVLGCGSVLYGVNFDYNSATILPESNDILDKLFEGLHSDSEKNIIIEGHTSSEGTETYNMDLSQRRAQSVVDALIGKGLEKGRIRANGFGESKPIASNNDETGRSMNRRVEVKCQNY